jgi:hypothetical protein|tara:strand:+ start:609 stop:935 length:327 start_codon:yes stop_codon:yes gene_type:complete
MELIISHDEKDPFNERDTFIEFVEATATLFSFMDFAGVEVTRHCTVQKAGTVLRCCIQVPYKSYSQMSVQELKRTVKLLEAIEIIVGSSIYELEWGGRDLPGYKTLRP